MNLSNASSRVRLRGYCWAIFSVLLVTTAQLMLKSSMLIFDVDPFTSFTALFSGQLSFKDNLVSTITSLTQHDYWALFTLTIGIICYGSSFLCWQKVLSYLPLNRAYALLSLSYILVYLFAININLFNESSSFIKHIAILLIVCGVFLTQYTKRASSTRTE